MNEKTSPDVRARRIVSRLKAEFLKDLDEDAREFQSDLFMAQIEAPAEWPAEFAQIDERKNKARKNSMQKLSNAANKLAEAYSEVDADSRAFLLHCVHRRGGGQSLPSWDYFLLSERARDDVQETLNLLAQAATIAAKDLPSTESTGLRSAVSTAVGNTFFDYKIQYSESEDSFAAECLGYAFDLMNLEGDLKYWIQQGKQSDSSSWNLVRKHGKNS